MNKKRTVFFVSDQTGVTAETMGHSLLTQFDSLDFRPVTLPFISTLDKAYEVVGKVNAVSALAEGKVKLRGDLALAMKLMTFFKLPA